MGSQQQFCLRWNNHQTNLLNVFDDLLQHETLVDVTLACEGLSMRAHKVVLSACSPYFQQLFLENPCKHPIVVLKDISYADMKTLIDFMYKGEVNVSHEQLSTLLTVADTLKVKGLAEVTEGMASQSIATERMMNREMPPVLEAQSALGATRRGAPSPSASRRRKRRRTSGGSNSGHSEDADLRAGVGQSGAKDLNGDAVAQQPQQTHSLDLPVVPKTEVIDVSYGDKDDEDMPTLRVSSVQGGREVRGSGVSDGTVAGPSTRSYARSNVARLELESTKDEDENFGTTAVTAEDDAAEITDLPFTQHLTIEPTASTSMMTQGPSTSMSHAPTDHSLYFPSTSSSSLHDAPPLPPSSIASTAASNAQGRRRTRGASVVTTGRRRPPINAIMKRNTLMCRRNRRSFSVAYKLRVVQEAEKFGVRAVSEKYDIRLDSLLQWLLKKASLQNTLQMYSGMRRKYVRRSLQSE